MRQLSNWAERHQKDSTGTHLVDVSLMLVSPDWAKVNHFDNHVAQIKPRSDSGARLKFVRWFVVIVRKVCS